VLEPSVNLAQLDKPHAQLLALRLLVLLTTTYLLLIPVLFVLLLPQHLAQPHVLLPLDSIPQELNVFNVLLLLQETVLLLHA